MERISIKGDTKVGTVMNNDKAKKKEKEHKWEKDTPKQSFVHFLSQSLPVPLKR